MVDCAGTDMADVVLYHTHGSIHRRSLQWKKGLDGIMMVCKEYRECCDPDLDLRPFKGDFVWHGQGDKNKLVFCKECGQIYYDMRPFFNLMKLSFNIQVF